MAGLFGKATDFYKSGLKATVSAALDIARDKVLPKQDISEENLISTEDATDFAGHTGMVNSLAISDDGETLFSAGKDRKIRMWHTRTGKSAGIVGDQESEVTCLHGYSFITAIVSCCLFIHIHCITLYVYVYTFYHEITAGQRDCLGQRIAVLLRHRWQHHEMELAPRQERLC